MKGKDKFTPRIVVRAVPFGTSSTVAPASGQSGWTLR
jgi:hypothetical protein